MSSASVETVEVWTPEEMAAMKKKDPIAWIVVQREIRRGEAVLRSKTDEAIKC
ncbi:MAG: hypothetical protein M0R03_14900 [Novosphingobium sp.]|nr:hypothetical protein [Novosphingobium sp.]